MTLIPPVVGPINTDLLGGGFFRQYSEIAPFTYRAGMTFASELEALRVWTFRTLVPFLNDEFGDMQDAWVENVIRLTSTINDGLKQQSADNAQKIADALTAIAEADIPITDPGVLAVLNSPTTGTRGWLDAHYQPVGNYQPAGSYVTRVTNARNGITGWFHVDDFGAVGDGIARDEAAIQAAIDAATAAYTTTSVLQRVYCSSKTYLCGNTVTDNPVAGIVLKSGVELFGPGTLRVAPGSYWTGTLYALIRSPATGVLTHAGIRDITVDGNRDQFNVPGGNNQASNIVLWSCVDVWIDNVTSYDASGEGIQIAGSTASLSRDIRIENCSVSNCSRIGIQVSHFDGLRIRNNRVAWTTDNAIDIYGERDDHSAVVDSVNFLIDNNTIHDCGNGIFPETVASGIISNNTIRNCNEGIHVNRINGEPKEILITGNTIYGGNSSVACTGDTGGVTIRNNMFEAFNTAGVSLGGAGRVSQYYILDNTMNGNADTTPKLLIKSGTDQAASIVHLRTLTRSKNRSVDTVNYCTNNANLSYAPAFSPGD